MIVISEFYVNVAANCPVLTKMEFTLRKTRNIEMEVSKRK